MSAVVDRAKKAGRVGRILAPLWLRGKPARVGRDDARLLLDPWYHDFSRVGLRTPQRGGIFPDNQRAKEQFLFPFVDEALGWARKEGADGFLELFCADGYYGVYAALSGATPVLGVDQDAHEVTKANLVARLVGATAAHFETGDVFECRREAGVVLCAGGLYHLSDPARLLDQLRAQARTALVVQTVHHIGVADPDYFETPAPGWTWGSRFSIGWLRTAVEQAGFEIVRQETNELTGNDRVEDRGSVYLLCRPA